MMRIRRWKHFREPADVQHREMFTTGFGEQGVMRRDMIESMEAAMGNERVDALQHCMSSRKGEDGKETQMGFDMDAENMFWD